MKRNTRSASRVPLTPWSQAALAACDWFVNSQVIQKKPYWDANHGRY